jgi:hypothetical protein
MTASGYFAFDSLPGKTAIGYIDHENRSWKTNIYSPPVPGGSDGGAFVTDKDMGKLWDALMNHELLSEPLIICLLTPHVQSEDGDSYGYGVKYHVMGNDPGENFHSAYYPASPTKFTVSANISSGAFDIMDAIEDKLMANVLK